MLDKKAKDRIIQKFKAHKNDTGSPQVQVALLTEEIKQLTNHLRDHKHDHSSRRGLLKKVGERRRLLHYLEIEDERSFEELATKLNLRIAKKMLERKELERELEEKKRLIEEEKNKAKISKTTKK